MVVSVPFAFWVINWAVGCDGQFRAPVITFIPGACVRVEEKTLACPIRKGMTEADVANLLGEPDGTLIVNKLSPKSVYLAHGLTVSYGHGKTNMRKVTHVFFHHR